MNDTEAWDYLYRHSKEMKALADKGDPFAKIVGERLREWLQVRDPVAESRLLEAVEDFADRDIL